MRLKALLAVFEAYRILLRHQDALIREIETWYGITDSPYVTLTLVKSEIDLYIQYLQCPMRLQDGYLRRDWTHEGRDALGYLLAARGTA